MQIITTTNSIAVRPKSKQELANEYEIHRNTISIWCQALGIIGRGRLNVNQVLQFYQHYGLPGIYQMSIQLA